jgi:vitamin B12 transporter
MSSLLAAGVTASVTQRTYRPRSSRWLARARHCRTWARGAVFLALVAPRKAEADEPIEIEVQADPIGLPPKEPSVAGGVIRRERLNSPGLEAGDVLRTQPGVAIFETGGYGSHSTASVRGASAAQTPVYLAGVRLNDDVGGTADLSTVPLWFLNRIEIYRSNAPLAGDQLGIGGAIFFEPRRPEGPEVSAGALGGSFGARALWARAGVGNERASALLGVRLDRAKNDYSYLNDGGTRFVRDNDHTSVFSNADTERLDVWAVGTTRLGSRGRADLVLNDVEREQGLQTFALFPTTMARVSFSRRLAALSTQAPCADTGCLVTTTASVIASHSEYDDPLREVGLGTNRLDLDGTRVEAGLGLRFSPARRFSITPAVRAAIDRLTIAGLGNPTAHARRVFSRAALQGEWTASEWLTLRALGSAECHGTSLEGPLPWSAPGDPSGSKGSATCAQFQPAARVGLELDSAPVTWLLNLGRYARVPTLAELYGVSGVVRGNTALLPERGVSLEAGARSTRSLIAALGGLSFDLFAFLRWTDDLISYQRSTSGYLRPFNLGAARVAGLELQSAYAPAPFLLFELAATLLDPRDASQVRFRNDLLPYQPRLTLAPRVEVRARFRRSVVDSAQASVSYFYESSRFADRAGLIVIPEQSSLDLGAEVHVRPAHLNVSARLSNVLGQTRFDLIGYPLPGRAAYLAMETEWH